MENLGLKIIGRKDKADLPDIEIENVDVKIDSGAYSCSIHCEEINLVEKAGKEVLEVCFLDKGHPQYSGKKFYFEEFKQKKVKSSTGNQQERFFIKLHIVLFEETFYVDFSLTRRNGLRMPILLGRKLLNKHFLIDTSKTNRSFKYKNKH